MAADQTIFRSSLLGPIREPAVTVAIDTSASMYAHLSLIEHGIGLWLQACSKTPFSPPRINLAALGAQPWRWRESVALMTPNNLGAALDWLSRLQCGGGECDLTEGMRLVLSDITSHAVYFITDGFTSTNGRSIHDTIAQLVKFNQSSQSIHVIIIGTEQDLLGDNDSSPNQIWRQQNIDTEPVDLTGFSGPDSKNVLLSLARQTLGSVRHVVVPPQTARGQVQVPHSTIVNDFNPNSAASATGKSRSTPLGHADPDFNSSVVTWGRPLTPDTARRTMSPPLGVGNTATNSLGMSTNAAPSSRLVLNPGASLEPVESLLGRFVMADYMKGMQVLAMVYGEGVYRPATITEQVDAEEFLVEFHESEELVDGHRPYRRQQKTQLTDLLAFIDAQQRAFDVTDRVLALRRDEHGNELYIPATVMKMSEMTIDGVHEIKVLVAFYDGQLEGLLHHQVLKISASRYLKAVQAISAESNAEWTSTTYSPLFLGPTIHSPRAYSTGTYERTHGSALNSPTRTLPSGGHVGVHGASRTAAKTVVMKDSDHDDDGADDAGGGVHRGKAIDDEDAFPKPTKRDMYASSAEKTLDVFSDTSSPRQHSYEAEPKPMQQSSGNGDALLNLSRSAAARAAQDDTARLWPRERLASGRVLNVTPDFQAGFEAGFATAQRTSMDIEEGKAFKQPSPSDMLRSYRKQLESRRSISEFQQSSRWQRTDLKERSQRGGRDTLLSVPREAIVQLSLNDRPWTAPSHGERPLASHIPRRQGLHGESVADTWHADWNRIDGMRGREERRQQIVAGKKEREERIKQAHMAAMKEREAVRRDTLVTVEAEKTEKRHRRSKSPAKPPNRRTDEEHDAKEEQKLKAMRSRRDQREKQLAAAERTPQARDSLRQVPSHAAAVM
ncbi:uncharacterized protein LOC135805365 isoform X2 [Sycon ciliatum]|uniref:uncharacterized protein LOC135805365 isoform X2 n=1 Tax=Sycon ciliatum TaxID=27933 RepID=UPI0031F6900B